MIILYYFGKKRELLPQEQELIRRIGFREKIDIRCLDQAGSTDGEIAKRQEGEKLLSKLKPEDFVWVLHEAGEGLDSIQFAKIFQQIQENHKSQIFVVGGAYGLSSDVLARADRQLSFGKMVWTRQLARYMTLEQLYRVGEINGGGHFHKE